MGVIVVLALLLVNVVVFEAKKCDSQRWNVIFGTLGLDDIEDTFMYVINSGDVRELCKGSIKTYPSLQLIVLNKCNITYIETGTFDDVGEISVELEGNKLTGISNGVFNGTQISSVNLRNNEISTIEPTAFNNMPNLQTILLDNNKIVLWRNEWFKNTPKLNTIIFSSNLLENLPEDAFKNFQQTRNLTVLLDGNKIKNIHEKSFHGLGEVMKINLARNELATLPQVAFSVQILDLQENNFTCFTNLQNVKIVKLQKNPLSEDCVEKLQKYAKNSGVRIYLSDDPFSYK